MVFAWLQSAMVGCIAVKVISLFSVQPCPLIPSSLKIKCKSYGYFCLME